jgi:hypothetical protein
MLHTCTRQELATLPGDALSDSLEQGNILYFPECPIDLPPEADLDFLRQKLPGMMSKKNASYHPESDRCSGIQGDAADVERARQILKAHSARVQAFLGRVTPRLTRDWMPGTSSFRPLQEKGRALSAHASNELIHVDAGAYGATHGDRVLRFFVNANDQGEDRVWTTKGTFQELFDRYGEAAGLKPPGGGAGRLDEGVRDHLRTALVDLLARLEPTAKTALDSSPYDRLMRRFHNFMKDTPAFQQSPVGHQEFRFRPYSAWMVFTDQVSHACIEGQHAFADTFIVRRASCKHAELTPYAVLERAGAR